MTIQLKTQNLTDYYELTRLNKPISILLLLWPMYWALWIDGNGIPALLVFCVVTLGVIWRR